MNRQRLLTLAVAANAVLTIVALIRIYTVSNIIQNNLAALSGNLQQLGQDVATLNEQVRRTTASVSDLTDGNLQAVHATVTHLTDNLASLNGSVANLRTFTQDQAQDRGSLSQSINMFAGVLRDIGAQVTAASTADGGPVPGAIADYRRDLSGAGAWALRQNTDLDGGVHAAIVRYAGTIDAASKVASETGQQYASELKSAGDLVMKAGDEGGSIASAQSAYKNALAVAGTKASDQVRDRLDRFFQDNQSALSKDLLKKIDARCQCTCGSPSSAGVATLPGKESGPITHTP